MKLRNLVISTIAIVLSANIAMAQDIQIEQPYARAASPVAKTGAAFMHIINNSDEDDVLVEVVTEAAKNPELHTHVMTDGVAKMREVEGGIPVSANDKTILQRGGLHVMLMGLTSPLEQGDTITMTLVFEKAGEVTIEVPVDNERQPEAMMEHKMDMEDSEEEEVDHSTMDH